MTKLLPTLLDLPRETVVLVEVIGILIPEPLLGALEEAPAATATDLVETIAKAGNCGTTTKGTVITTTVTATTTEIIAKIISDILQSVPFRFSMMESTFLRGKTDLYDLRAKILWTDENTRYHGPDAEDGEEIWRVNLLRNPTTMITRILNIQLEFEALLIILKLQFISENTQLSLAHVKFTLLLPETPIHLSTRKSEYSSLLQPRNQAAGLSTDLKAVPVF